MKINEVIISELSPEGQAAERQRAQGEVRLLWQIDPQFASKFEKSFRKYGKKSVDTAYQAAITDIEKQGGNSSDIQKLQKIANMPGGWEDDKKVRAFVSAIPSGYRKTLPSYVNPGDRIGATGRRWGNQYYAGGGVDSSDSFVDPNSPGIGKTIKKLGTTAKDVWQNARASKGFKMGSQIGKSLSKYVSDPTIVGKN